MWPIWNNSSETPDTSSTQTPRPEPAAAAASKTKPLVDAHAQIPTINVHPTTTASEEFEAITLQAQEAVRPLRTSGRLTPSQLLQRIRSRSRGQSPSTSPRVSTPNVFNFPPTMVMDPELLKSLVEAAVTAATANQAANN